MWDQIWPYLAGIIPTIVASIFFYRIMKAMIQGDREERLAQARWEAEHQSAEKAGEKDGSAPE